MKVFMSWSGERSKAAAELLKWWTRSVIQASRPWISTEDVDRGALWFTEINNGLNETAIGIVCLTHENKERPWILFEAGALAKGLSNNRVCTFLVDLTDQDIKDPLAQFNHTTPTEGDMRKLARTLNRGLGANALEDDVLTDAFNAYWGQFKERFEAIERDIPQAVEVVKRPADDIMSEILENVRGMNQRIRKLEAGGEQLLSWDEPSLADYTRRDGIRTLHAQMSKAYIQGIPLTGFLAEGEALGIPEATVRHIAAQISVEAANEVTRNRKAHGKGLQIKRTPNGAGPVVE